MENKVELFENQLSPKDFIRFKVEKGFWERPVELQLKVKNLFMKSLDLTFIPKEC